MRPIYSEYDYSHAIKATLDIVCKIVRQTVFKRHYRKTGVKAVGRVSMLSAHYTPSVQFRPIPAASFQ